VIRPYAVTSAVAAESASCREDRVCVPHGPSPPRTRSRTSTSATRRRWSCSAPRRNRPASTGAAVSRARALPKPRTRESISARRSSSLPRCRPGRRRDPQPGRLTLLSVDTKGRTSATPCGVRTRFRLQIGVIPRYERRLGTPHLLIAAWYGMSLFARRGHNRYGIRVGSTIQKVRRFLSACPLLRRLAHPRLATYAGGRLHVALRSP
jgi:hypothetical protein